MKKQIIMSVAALTMLLTGAYFTNQAFAKGGGLGEGDFANRFASHFNLDQSEVEGFMLEERETFKADREAEFTTNLDSAINAGDLTAEQKDLILAKHEELQANHESMPDSHENWQDLTQEERGTARDLRQTDREAERAELEAWADDNGIDLKYLNQHEGGFKGGGRGNR